MPCHSHEGRPCSVADCSSRATWISDQFLSGGDFAKVSERRFTDFQTTCATTTPTRASAWTLVRRTFMPRWRIYVGRISPVSISSSIREDQRVASNAHSRIQPCNRENWLPLLGAPARSPWCGPRTTAAELQIERFHKEICSPPMTSII